ncbi:MAG TPA: helix-turn-helix domain-containing protein, partial [Povalibacter sp.]
VRSESTRYAPYAGVETMNTLQSSFYAVAIFSCLLCAFVVSGKRAPKRFNYLIAYLVLESLRYVFQWLMIQPAAPAKSLWLGSLMISSFLVAPALWMFAREIAEGRAPPLRSLRGPHLAVILAGVLLTVPLLLRTYGGTEFGDPGNPASPLHKLFINATMLAAVVLFLGQVPYYLTACVRLLGRHVDLSKAMFSDVEPNSTGTLRLLIFIVSINWLVGLLRALHCMTIGFDTGLGIVLCVLEVGVTAAVVIALMRRTTVFSIEDRELAEEAVATKYARSALDTPARSRIRRKLAEAMTTRGLHRDNRVTLRALCESLKENPHYVSQVINQDLATNFYDLIKKHRVEDAMTALVTEPDKSVLDIALAVGFNSKSTFNAAFRQYAGMTPREYRSSRKDAPDQVQTH